MIFPNSVVFIPEMLAGSALSAAICWFMIRNLRPVLRKERMQEDATSTQSMHRGSTLRFGGVAVICFDIDRNRTGCLDNWILVK